MIDSTQLAIVGVLVSAATAYLVRASWRALIGRSGAACASACGGCASEEPAPERSRFPLPQVKLPLE